MKRGHRRPGLKAAETNAVATGAEAEIGALAVVVSASDSSVVGDQANAAASFNVTSPTRT